MTVEEKVQALKDIEAKIDRGDDLRGVVLELCQILRDHIEADLITI